MEARRDQDPLFRCGNEGVMSCRLCWKKDYMARSCRVVEKDGRLDGRHTIEEAIFFGGAVCKTDWLFLFCCSGCDDAELSQRFDRPLREFVRRSRLFIVAAFIQDEGVCFLPLFLSIYLAVFYSMLIAYDSVGVAK